MIRCVGAGWKILGGARQHGGDTSQEEVKRDYAATNRIQLEQIAGDQCASAITVIDQ